MATCLTDGNYYTHRDKKYVRVSAIAGQLTNLAGWAARETAADACARAEAYANEKADASIATRLREAELDIAKAPWRKSRKAMNRGRGLHTVAAAFGELDWAGIPEELRPWADGLAKFRREHIVNLIPGWVERSVINTIFDYAGTLDAVIALDGVATLIDYKTVENESKARVWNNHRWQLAAYRLSNYGVFPDGSREDLPGITRSAIIHIYPGGYKLTHIGWEKAWPTFCHLIEVWRAIHEQGETNEQSTDDASSL